MKKIVFLVSLLFFITVATVGANSDRVSRVGTTNISRTNLNKDNNLKNTNSSRIARSSYLSHARSSIESVSDKRSGSVNRSARNTSNKFIPKVSRVATKTGKSDLSTSITRSIKISRSGITSGRISKLINGTLGRSAKKTVDVSRSGVRATKVFDDVSKIGGGYEKCRNAYNTCMDQLCAKSNDTFRRCYCSEKVTEFKETEAVFDKVKSMLQSFQDNNLNAVNKTAAEVDAMYSATAGENAIKKDTSGAAAILDEIGDLLSGKKKLNSESGNKKVSLDLSSDMEDIWSGGSDFLSDNNGVKDLTLLEGESLYKASEKQCYQVIKSECENETVLSMVRSSYTILIANDCNLYEKKLSTKKMSVANTVREAEKKLREARLEEYKAHNSQDMNDCISKVKAAITSSNEACGKDYQACLDPTGLYINKTNGEPIYSPHLFKLTEVINLYDKENKGGSVLSRNETFNNFLNEKRIFVERALDSCRDLNTSEDRVWNIFKESAIIEIAQAQDKKIEEVKGKCVLTMKECYDTASGGLAKFDDTTAQQTGALQAFAARKMCQDKVAACAALYAEPNDKTCEFDNQGKLTTPDCGLKALLAFVQTVDNVKVSEGCEKGLDIYIKKLCGDDTDKTVYPLNCKIKKLGEKNNIPNGGIDGSIYANLKQYAVDNCLDPDLKDNEKNYDKVQISTQQAINRIINDITDLMDAKMYTLCKKERGIWYGSKAKIPDGANIQKSFYQKAFAGNENMNWGKCIENSVMILCEMQNKGKIRLAEYNSATQECEFTDEWYKIRCNMIGGEYEENVCYR